MKTFNRLFVGLILAFGAMACLSLNSSAGVAARPPGRSTPIGYTTAISSITSLSVLQSTSGLTSPGAVYQVILGTGATGDYCVLYDTTTSTGLAVPVTAGSNITAQIGPRLFFTSTSQNTTITFDPPILFYSGLMYACTNVQDGGAITFEEGRGLQQ